MSRLATARERFVGPATCLGDMIRDHPTKRDRDAQFQREALCWLPDVTRFALSLTRNEADADDLVQETFLRAYRSWEHYALGTECRGWLFTICRNTFLRTRERARREVSSDDPEVEALAAAAIHAAAVQSGQGEVFATVDLSEIGTAVMTVVGLWVAPVMGMPPMNPAEMLAMSMGGSIVLGWISHLMIGVVLAIIYALVVSRLRGPSWARGALYGVAPWLAAQLIVIPMMGMLVFSGSVAMALGSLIGHLVYGAIVGGVYGAGSAQTTRQHALA